MENKLHPTNKLWRKRFLQYVAGKLAQDWTSREVIADMTHASTQGNEAHDLMGFPSDLWQKISLEHDLLVPADKREQYRFLAGLAIGWVEARKHYDKGWEE